jgi:hypothetical protein
VVSERQLKGLITVDPASQCLGVCQREGIDSKERITTTKQRKIFYFFSLLLFSHKPRESRAEESIWIDIGLN